MHSSVNLHFLQTTIGIAAILNKADLFLFKEM